MIESLFPTSTLVGRPVPKKTFIEQLGADARLKGNFTNYIERITWVAKLAPSTIHVADGQVVHEITVFKVAMKVKDCPTGLFTFIDTWMPRHLLFALEYAGQISLLIHYKEPSEAATGQKYRIVRAYQTAWQDAGSVSLSLQGLSMDTIYENLVRQIAGGQITYSATSLRQAIEETSEMEAIQNQIAILEKRMATERQPQKKFALHQEILKLKKQLLDDNNK